MQDVSLPKSRVAKDTYAYSLEEVTAMLIRLPLRSAAVIAVAAFTGLRKGEIAALKWDNYRDGLLYVEQSKWRVHLDDPKTNKSNEVPCPRHFASGEDPGALAAGQRRPGVRMDVRLRPAGRRQF